MKKYVFPAVFYKNVEEEGFVVAFEDMPLFCAGSTMEEAYSAATKILNDFVKISIQINGDVEETPRSFEEAVKLHKGQTVMLITAEV